MADITIVTIVNGVYKPTFTSLGGTILYGILWFLRLFPRAAAAFSPWFLQHFNSARMETCLPSGCFTALLPATSVFFRWKRGEHWVELGVAEKQHNKVQQSVLF